MIELASILLFGAAALALTTQARPVQRALLVAFSARAGAALIGEYVYRFPAARGDALSFDAHAWELAQMPFGLFVAQANPASASSFFPWVIAWVYRAIGHVPLVPVLINVFLGTLTVFFVYKATRIVWGRATAVRVTWLAAVFPSFIHYSAGLLREAAIVLPLTIGAYYFVRYLYQGRRPADAIWAVVFVALSSAFHGAMIVGLVGLLLYFMWRGVRGLFWAQTIALREALTIGFLAVVVFPIVLYWGSGEIEAAGTGYFQRLVEPEAIVAEAESRTITRGAATYPDFLTVEGPVDLIVKLPPRLVYFLFSPFPWDVQATSHVIGLVDMVFYVAIFYSMYARWPDIRGRKVVVFLFMLIPFLLAFSLGTSNFGTAIRHRAKFFSLLLILSGGIWGARRLSYARDDIRVNRQGRLQRARGYG